MGNSVLRMTASPEFIRRMKERFAEIAVAKAKLGLPKAVIIQGVVYREFPDGRLEPVDPQKTAKD
ncbi:hypothetical protein GmRootV118_02600 [Variovorax sp. V118]